MTPRNAGTAREIQELKEKNTRLQESYNALLAKLEALESNQRRAADEGVDSEEEEETQKDGEEEVEEEQVDLEEKRKIRILKAMKNEKHKVRGDIPMYDGSLKEEELLDWIASMDAYFESEEVPDEQTVRLAKDKT